MNVSRRDYNGAGAADTVYIRDGQTVIAEYAAATAAASPVRKYVNASYVDEPVLLIDRTDARGGPGWVALDPTGAAIAGRGCLAIPCCA